MPRGYDAVALGLFAAGAAWAGIRLIAPRSRAAYLRLCICCGGMVVMLLPAATVAASSSQALASMPSGMPGMAPANRPTASAAAVPRSVTLLLLAALLLVVVSQAIAVSRRRGAHRLARGLEIGTAAAMATMLGLAL